MNSQPKPVFVPVTDPAIIEAIRRNGSYDPIGGEHGGRWYAYAWSLERYRTEQGKEGGCIAPERFSGNTAGDQS